jgi:hypothetical protein
MLCHEPLGRRTQGHRDGGATAASDRLENAGHVAAFQAGRRHVEGALPPGEVGKQLRLEGHGRVLERVRGDTMA